MKTLAITYQERVLQQETQRIEKVLADLRAYQETCTEKALMPNAVVAELLIQMGQSGLASMQQFLKQAALEENESVCRYYGQELAFETYRRFVLQLGSFLCQALAWRSEPEMSSITAFGLRSTIRREAGQHYDREGHSLLEQLESQLLSFLEFPSECVALVATSSGMAAYTLIEAVLLRHILKENDVVILAPRIWWEVHEQISVLPHIQTRHFSSFTSKDIVDEIITHQPRVVLIDPLTNFEEMHAVNLSALIQELDQKYEHELYLIIDGTMISSTCNPYQLQNPKGRLHIIYYESCIKYLEYGLDLVQAGFVAFPPTMKNWFISQRIRTGTMLYAQVISLFPELDRDLFLERMRCISQNALQVASNLCNGPAREILNVSYPGLFDHPYYDACKNYSYLGGVICLSFRNQQVNQRSSYTAFIEVALSIARTYGLPLVKGESFGFSISRLTFINPWRDMPHGFIRLSVGTGTLEMVETLAHCLSMAALAICSDRPRDCQI